MKKKIVWMCLILSAFLSLSGAPEKIQVYRVNSDVFRVRSSWSATEDLIVEFFRFANEKAYIVAKGTPFAEVPKKGKLLRASGDDYPAVSPLGGYRILSGNHGSPFTRTIFSPGHGLGEKDLGGVILAGKKNHRHIIMQIVDKDRIIIHPEGVDNTVQPAFLAHVPAEKLTYKGKDLPFTKSVFTQLYPLNRVTRFQLLADGKNPVPMQTVTDCSFLDFYFHHDVIDPYAAVQSVKNNPGVKPFPQWQGTWAMTLADTVELQKKYAAYMKLRALATFENHFRFEAGGAYVNYRKVTYHMPLSTVRSLEVMASCLNGAFGREQEKFFYVPKLKKIKTKYKNNPALEFDFVSGFTFGKKRPQVSYSIQRKDALRSDDLPDRFICVTGNGKERRYGLALGYSLFMGCTGQKADLQMRNTLYYLWHTWKMYPMAYLFPSMPAGKVMESVSYKQYFNPQKEKDATSFYCHHQGKSYIVYLDFHKELKNKVITIPSPGRGKKITILEKTPSVTFHTKKQIPADGKICLDVTGKHGYLVLKLD